MTSVASLYNCLPTIEEADANFQVVDRTTLFSKLAPLLAAYEHKFGVCLVHAHCKLDDGEKMVSSGNVSQPEIEPECYPERWLASGEPYEFSKDPTVSPPAELFDQFRGIVGDYTNILGIYAAGDNPHSGILQEWTEGRKNITQLVDEMVPGDIETGWLPGTANPTTMACTIICRQLEKGHIKVHLGGNEEE